MKKVLLKWYFLASILLLVSSFIARKFIIAHEPIGLIIIMFYLININISSIMFYISFLSKRKIYKILFSIINSLIFIFVGGLMIAEMI